MSDPIDPKTGGGPRRRNWLLVASLALNLLVLAWAGMAALHWTGVIGHHGGPGYHASHWGDGSRFAGDGRGFQRPRGLFRSFLEDEDIGENPRLSALFSEYGPPLRSAFREARTARRQLHDLMEEAEDGRALDKAALGPALADVRATTASVQERMHALLLSAADTLSPEEFEELVEHGGPRRHHFGDDDD